MAVHLSDAFMDTFAYVVYFLKNAPKSSASYDEVRQRILGLLSQGRDMASSFPPEDYDAARFAVCAWIDEAVMNSSWPHRAQWMREPLQLAFYNTTNAGELFFERLGVLDMHQNEVREVYYLCLSMGFAGRFVRQEDRFLLDQLKTSNLKVLAGSSLGVPDLKNTTLFAEAYPTLAPSVKTHGPRGMPGVVTSAIALLPLALFLGMYLVYSFVLGNVADSFFGVRP